MLAAILFALIGLATAQTGNVRVNSGSYMALFSRTLESNSTFRIYFELLRPVAYETIEAHILYVNTSDEVPKNKTISSGSLSLSSGKQEGLIEITIPELSKENSYSSAFYLYMKGKGILNFENMTSVNSRYWLAANKLDEYIFIQTDKAAFKTGQTVKYRVFVLDKEMKPVDPVMTINLYDAKGNKMKEHVNVSGSFGISGELPLSEKPTLGRWRIDAILAKSGKLERLGFDVEEYVLPKYEVKVELPDYGTVANPELKGKVTAKYTYGKPVKGHVTLKVSKQGGYWWFYEPRAIQTEFEIDGTAEFSIATDTLLKFDPELKYDTLTVEANVTEKETGEVRIATSSITFHEKPIKIEFMGNYGDDVFKPGFKYTNYIKVSLPDKRPLPTSGERVKVSVTYFTDSPSQAALPFRPPHSPSSNLMEFISPFPGGDVIFMPDMYITVPRDGIIKLDLDIPANAATAHIDVRIKEEKVSKNIQRFRTLSKSYLHLDMKTSFVKVGQQAEFSIRSNIRPDNRVTYHIIRGNDIVETHYTMIGSPYNPNTFYVTMTSDMIPESTILAYFYNSQHGEVVADAIKFKVDRSSKHDVTLHFDKTQVSPGTNVTLSARADPGSQVFILAVDKSVILHRTGNDITKNRVNEKLGISNSPSWKYQDSVLFQRVLSADPLGIFDMIGLQVFTDAVMYDFNLWNLKSEILRSGNPCGQPGGMCSCIHGCEVDVNEKLTDYGDMGWSWSGGSLVSVRKFFPETWIWANESVSSSGHVEMTATVPDTVTDWITTGFALNRESGIGFVTEPVNVTAFLPFFVSLHLPFSIVSGEVVVIQALVFNYYPHDLYVTVSLKNSSEEFMGVTVNKYGQEEETKDKVQKCILVKSNDASSAYFTIKALKIGTLDLEVEALSTRGRDTVRRQLIVRPAGKQEETNIPTLISMEENDSRPHITDIQIAYPLRIVPDSQRIQITVIGDIFGPTLDHLDQLIKIPYGCGEQNMVRFAPAVYAARYLKVTGRFTDTMKAKIEDILMKGYQRELTYQRYDGSFSAFGDKDSAGSLWLTAFVLKTFAQASEFTYIDPNAIRKCVDFILKNQNLDGSFNTTGFVHNKALQGGSASTSKTLAAYVFVALKEVQDKNLLENETAAQNLTRAAKLAFTYVQDTSSRLSDEYELAIAAYAVAKMDAPGAKPILDRLERSSKMVQSDGTKHWENTVKTLEIETAAYVALLHAQLKPIDLPVLKWLIQNRSPYGGYLSTQDTVVALQALAETAALIYSTDVNMTIDFDYGGEKPKQVTVNTDNMDILQFVDVPENIRGIRMTSQGSGMALVEVSVFYNILDEERNPNFDLVVTTNGTEVDRFTLKSCARWLGIDDSGMVLMEIGFPSGFKPILEPRKQIIGGVEFYSDRNGLRVSRTEMDHDRLVLYYDKMDEELECYTVDVVRESTIGHSQPASVRVYTYYDTGKSASKFYLPNTLKKNYICDYCGVECGCGFDPEAVPPERCYATGMMRMSNYKMFQPPILYRGQPETKTVNTAIYPDHTSSQTTIYTGKSNNEHSIYPGQSVSRRTTYHGQTVSEEQHPSLPVVGRTIETVDPISMQTLRQRLQPNRWHRGSTIPVSFSGTGHFQKTFPSLEDNFETLSRSWKITGA